MSSFIVSPSSETGFLLAYRVVSRFYRLSFFRDRLSFSIPCRSSFLSSLLLQRLDFLKHSVSYQRIKFYRLSFIRDRLSFSIPWRMTFLSSLLLQRQAFFQYTASYHSFIVSPSSETGFLSAYVLYRMFHVSPSSETFTISVKVFIPYIYYCFYRLI